MVDILIADDEYLARETIKHLLNQCTGIGKIYEANNGKTALALAKQHRPKIVMLDIEMPILNGIDVARQLEPDTRIIFITAFSHVAVPKELANCVGYLLKPFKDEDFYRCFEHARSM
jgi:two-component system LytT family response regulator